MKIKHYSLIIVMIGFVGLNIFFSTFSFANISIEGFFDEISKNVEGDSGKVNMHFQITGLQNKGEFVKMIGTYLDKKFLADSAQIENDGNFTFKPSQNYTEGFYYILTPGDLVVKLLLDKDQVFDFTANASNIDGTAKIEGSQTLSLFYQDLNFKRPLDEKYNPVAQKIGAMSLMDPSFNDVYDQFKQLSRQYEDHNNELIKNYPDNFFTKFKIGGRNPELTFPKQADGNLDVKAQAIEFRNHFWDGFDFNWPALINTPAFYNKLNRYFSELVPQNQDSINKVADILMKLAYNNDEYYKVISNWVALKYEPGKTKLMDGEAVYSHIILTYFTPEKATWLDEESIKQLRKRCSEMTPSLLNKKAGNVTAMGYDKKMHTLFDFTAPVIIVYIYNPDCSHCEKETPELKEFYSKWKTKGLEIFSIAANTNAEDWKGFQDRFHLPWTDVFDETNASWYPKYFVDNTPEIYVLDKNRNIFAKNLQVNQLEAVMNRINK